MKILLVEPAYYTHYPPLGLLKLSTLYKAEGHEVRFVRGLQLPTRLVPDEIQVTSLFTWAWRPVWEAIAFYKALFSKAKVTLGAIYATLMPDHARDSGAHEVVTGLNKSAEDLMPDYELVPDSIRVLPRLQQKPRCEMRKMQAYTASLNPDKTG